MTDIEQAPSDQVIGQVSEHIENNPETVAEEKQLERIAEEKQPERTFTQAELDDIVKRRVAKASAAAARKAEEAFLQRQRANVEKPLPENYETDEQYLEAVVEQRIAEKLQHESKEKEAASIGEKADAIMVAASKVNGFDQEFFYTLPITAAIAQTIVHSDIGDKLVVHFHDNPAEIERISALPTARQAAEIGKIEASLQAKMQVKAPTVSKAPAPIVPISAHNGGNKSPADMSDAEYAIWRKKTKK